MLERWKKMLVKMKETKEGAHEQEEKTHKDQKERRFKKRREKEESAAVSGINISLIQLTLKATETLIRLM